MRKVRTASGATAVQIVSKSGGVRRIVEHLGSAHTKAGLEALPRGWAAEDRRLAGPGDAGPGVPGPSAWTHRPGRRHGWPPSARPCSGTFCTGRVPAWDWARRSGGDRAFEQMVLARLIVKSRVLWWLVYLVPVVAGCDCSWRGRSGAQAASCSAGFAPDS